MPPLDHETYGSTDGFVRIKYDIASKMGGLIMGYRHDQMEGINGIRRLRAQNKNFVLPMTTYHAPSGEEGRRVGAWLEYKASDRATRLYTIPLEVTGVSGDPVNERCVPVGQSALRLTIGREYILTAREEDFVLADTGLLVEPANALEQHLVDIRDTVNIISTNYYENLAAEQAAKV